MLIFVLSVMSALVFSFLCSLSEATLLSVKHAQVQALGDTKAGKILRRFKSQIDVPIAAVLVLNTIANTAGGSLAGASWGEVFDPSTVWIFSLTFTFTVLLFTEIVPKTLGVAYVDRLAPFVARFVDALTVILRPVLFVTKGVSNLLRRGQQDPVTSVEEIRLLVALGRTEGAVGAFVAGMIEGATSLRELTAYDIMVPRGGVRFLSAKRSLEDNLKQIRESGHSRFPFTPTGDIDQISGVVLVKDLMFQLRESPDDPKWEAHLGPLLIVPGAMRVDQLLREFQDKRRHLAIVVDEYGGTIGIVTLEDVLEEIVGEILDESDRVDPFIIKRTDGSLMCRGWAETRKVFELLGIKEEVETVTIGGFVAEQLGRVPKAGDIVKWNGFGFKVTAASPRRAERVDVYPLGEALRASLADIGR